MLEITKKNKDDEVMLALKGRLDTKTAPQLDEEIIAVTKDGGSLLLDFAELDYISSAGLRVILSAFKRIGGNETVINVKPQIMEIFDMTGFADILDIRPAE